MPSEAKKKQQQKKKEAAKARQQNTTKSTTVATSATKSKTIEPKKLNPVGDRKENGVNGAENAELLAEGKFFRGVAKESSLFNHCSYVLQRHCVRSWRKICG